MRSNLFYTWGTADFVHKHMRSTTNRAIMSSASAEIGACVRRMALQGAPSSPSYALNLMHALELQQDYARAVHVAVDYCAATRCSLANPLSCQMRFIGFTCLCHKIRCIQIPVTAAGGMLVSMLTAIIETRRHPHKSIKMPHCLTTSE